MVPHVCVWKKCTALVALGNIRASVRLCEVVAKGLRALFSAQQRLGKDPLARLEIALDEASVLPNVLDHIADNVGLVALGLRLLVLVQHAAHKSAKPLVARVEVKLLSFA